MINHLIDRIKGKIPKGKKRSNNWAKWRREFLEYNPYCKACGTLNKLEVHHILAFHTNPELEGNPKNMITLCGHCHFWFGHNKDWKVNNLDILKDANYLYAKLIREK